MNYVLKKMLDGFKATHGDLVEGEDDLTVVEMFLGEMSEKFGIDFSEDMHFNDAHNFILDWSLAEFRPQPIHIDLNDLHDNDGSSRVVFAREPFSIHIESEDIDDASLVIVAHGYNPPSRGLMIQSVRRRL